jgi:cell division protein FtsW
MRLIRRRLGQTDYALLGAVLALLVLGLEMVYSASFVIAHNNPALGSDTYFFTRQLLWALLGGIALVLCARLDYHWWQRAALPLSAIVGLMLLAVAATHLGHSAYGAQRWLRLGPLPPIQPSEFAKLALVLGAATWLSRHRDRLASLRSGLLPFSLALAGVATLIMLQPDLGSTIVLVLTAWTLLFLAGAPVWHILLVGGAGLAAILALSLSAPYRLQRVMAFLDPSQDPLGIGWHIIQATIALGSGGLLGRGLGASRQKFYYLPSAHTDAIFAVIGEELGFLGTTAVLGLLAVLAYRGLQIALQAPDTYGGLLAAGITTWLVCQALINIGVVTAVLPFTGIPLPFVSFGGSSLVVSLAAIGIVLNIARQSVHEESS